MKKAKTSSRPIDAAVLLVGAEGTNMVDEMPTLNRRSLLTAAIAMATVRFSTAAEHVVPAGTRAQSGFRVPSNFRWGASTAGHQIEGNNVNSDMWLLENVKPTIFKERSGDACDSYHRYEEDIALVRALGLDSYRFSLEWSRIEPTQGNFSIAEIDYYKRVIESCHRHGVRPAVSFNHYANPAWFAAAGGWASQDSPALFARYCDQAARHLADGMDVAFTLNEPNADRLARWIPYFEQMRPKAVVAAMEAAAAARSGSTRFVSRDTADQDAILEPMISAHKQAHDAIKAVRSELPVGVTLSLMDLQAAGPNSRVAQVRNDADGAWLQAARTGDFVGVQHYARVLFDDKGFAMPPPGNPVTDMGMELYPDGLDHVVRFAHENTGLPVLISENGVGTKDDRQRVAYIGPALTGLGRAMADGVPVLGYYHWSLLDNFEWTLGYDPHFGLVAVDRMTFRRTPKPSAYYYGSIARRRTI